MLSSTQNKISYVVGSTAVFPFAVYFFEKTDISCSLAQNGTTRELSASEFSVETKTSYAAGANITLLIDPLPAGAVLTIFRRLPLTQGMSLPSSGKLPTESLEKSLDRQAMMTQQQQEELDRAIKVPNSENVGGTLPGAAARGGMVLGFDEDGALTVKLPAAEAAAASAAAANASRIAAAASQVSAASSASAAVVSANSAAASETVAENAAAIAAATLDSINAVADGVQINEVHLELGRRIGDPGASLVYGRRI